MSRHILIQCPHCLRSDLRIRPELLGQRVKCKHCETIFVSTAPDEPPSAVASGTDITRRATSTGRPESRSDQAEEARRLEEELLVDRGRLRESQVEVERLRADLKATQEGVLHAARGVEAVAQERDRVTALLGRLDQESVALRAELEAARRDREVAARRAEEAEGLARGLRDELEARPAGLAERVGLLTGERDEALARCALLDGRREALGAEVERLGRRVAELEAGGDRRAREEAEAAGLRSELEAARRGLDEATRRVEDLAGRAATDARDLAEARRRAEEAEGLVLGLRRELEIRPPEPLERLQPLDEELEAARSERDAHATEAARLRDALDQAEAATGGEVASLRGELEEARRGLEEASRLSEERDTRIEQAERLVQATREEAENQARELAERLALSDRERESWEIERDQLRGEAAAARSDRDEQGEAMADLRGRLEGMARDLEAAAADRSRLEAELDGLRVELEAARRGLEEATRRAEEREARVAESEALAQVLRDELAEQSAASSSRLAGLTQERDAALARSDLLRDELGAESERQTRKTEELEILRERLEGEVAGLLGELVAARRGLEEQERRGSEAEESVQVLRIEADRREEARLAGREEEERAALALRRELEEARSREAAERDKAAAQGEAMADLDRRLAAALDDLHRATGRAEMAEAEVGSLRELRDDSTGDPQARVEALSRQLAEARQANLRLSSLLGVFGMTKETASRVLGRVEASATKDGSSRS